MALSVPKVGLSTMMKEGAQHFHGMEEAVFRNINACKELARVTQTSYGPNGMNKMVINHLEKLFVTNDAATVIKELEVEHPAARMLVMATKMQEQEVGDGTNFVIILAGELLHQAEELLKMGLSPAEVIEGYELACDKALEALPNLTCWTVKDLRSQTEVQKAVKTAIGSMQVLLSKFDLRRVCKTVQATALPKVVPPSAEEAGHCDLVEVEEIGGTTVVVFRQDQEGCRISTIVVRGSTENIMDDVERTVDDGVNTFKALTRDPRFLPGAGATEIELAKQLTSYAETCHGMEQYSIKAFAEALEVLPRALAENAGVKGNEVISKLYAAHQGGEVNTGFDNEGEGSSSSGVVDVLEKGVLDLYLGKFTGVKLACSAACTVLRVDQIIMAKRAGGPKPRQNAPLDADD